MRPSLLDQSPGSRGSKRAVRWPCRSVLGLVIVPLGPRSFEVGLQEAGKLVEEVELGEQAGAAGEGEGVRGVAQAEREGRVASRLGRLGTGGEREVAGGEADGVGGELEGDGHGRAAGGEHGGAVAQAAAPGRVRDLRRALGEERLGVEGHARARVAREAGEALVEGGARVAGGGRLAGRLRRAERVGAGRHDDHAVGGAGRGAVGGSGRGGVGGEGQPRLGAVDRHRRAPAEERMGLVGGERAVRDPRRELLHRQADERLARVEVEDDVGGGGRDVGERLGACAALRLVVVAPAQQDHDDHGGDEDRHRGEQQRSAAAEHRRHGIARYPDQPITAR